MKKILLVMIAVFLLTAGSANPRQIPLVRAANVVTTGSNGVLYVAETGQYLHGTFRLFYERNGGYAMFGNPLTPMISENGLRVQYFERARFEVPIGRDEQERVTLGRLGAYVLDQMSPDERAASYFAPTVARGDGQYFHITQHNVVGRFLQFWQDNGGLPIFGYPLSEEYYQVIGDEIVLVQYFERVRLEMRIVSSELVVSVAKLGRTIVDANTDLFAYTAPMPGLERIASATTSYKGAGWSKRTNIARGAAMIDGAIVAPGLEYSFLESSNFIDTDFVIGYGISGDQLVSVIAGGICQVSTTVFRAASNGGFEITKRIPHSYIVTTYEDILGFDATVMSPTTDFRFRNDTRGPLLLVVRNEFDEQRLTIEFWGIPDGRTVQYEGPYITNVTRPYSPVWQYDASLAEGQTRQLVYGRGGMSVSYKRTVLNADGSLLRADDYRTTYAPWYDYVLYGPGVQPHVGVRVR
jgi:hypothetical protein